MSQLFTPYFLGWLGAQVQASRQYWRSQPRGLSTRFGDIRIGQR